MKFLIHSNGPTISTGYGVQARYLSDRLAAAGHEVAVSCTYGHAGPVSNWRSPSGHDVRLYPQGYEVNSPDVLIAHAEHWFDGDPKNGWIILLVDVWAFQRPKLMETLRDFQVISWCPVDHWPVPRGVAGFLQGSAAIPVAMSRFGENELIKASLDPAYVPLSVDTTVYKPTPYVTIGDRQVNARELFELPMSAFVVGMVAMNKGWARDRKGFCEAFQAFAQFHHDHPDSVLFVHSEKHGAAEGIDLEELAVYAGIPHHAIVFSQQYAYRLGMPADMMAAAYTAMDVLLAPSHGEGFCVPLIEAQACGVPVIASSWTAQPELVGAGWTTTGQLEWDPAQHAWYQVSFVHDIVDKLEQAYNADLPALGAQAIEFAAGYDVDVVFDQFWRPFLATLEPAAPVVKSEMEQVDVLVPLVRDANRKRLMDSFVATAPKGKAHLIAGEDDTKSYAENVNALLKKSKADWILVVGDDVEFTPGWFEAARAVSTTADLIGTNDSEEGRTRNPDVANGRHADHFFIRRAYIDEQGSSLDGPGVVMPTVYKHWYVDREVVQLAKARGVYAHAWDCRIIHHHPGYDGNEDARRADPLYMRAVENADADKRTWLSRAPLIEGHRVIRGGR